MAGHISKSQDSGDTQAHVASGQSEQRVLDNDVRILLLAVLKELKKMNLHLAIINDEIINDTEVN